MRRPTCLRQVLWHHFLHVPLHALKERSRLLRAGLQPQQRGAVKRVGHVARVGTATAHLLHCPPQQLRNQLPVHRRR